MSIATRAIRLVYRTHSAQLAVAAVQLVTAGCFDSPPARVIAVELTGCETLQSDGVCVLADAASLQALLPEPWAERATFHSADGALTPSEVDIVQGGKRARLNVSKQASFLEVQSRHEDVVGRYRIVLRHAPLPAALRKAEELRDSGDLDGAAQLLHNARSQHSGLDLARVTGRLARIELARGRYEDAVRTFREALALDRAHGLASREVEDACSLAFLLTTRLHRFDEAQLELDRARQVAMSIPAGRALFPYFEALIDLELGDLRRALSSFRSSYREANKLGLTRHARTAQDRVAAVLQALGRTTEAIDALSTLLQTPTDNGCDNADVLINLGWFQLETPLTGGAHIQRARAQLERALGLFPDRCSDPFRRAVAETNLAFVFVQLSDADSARAHLSAAQSAGEEDLSLAGWWLLLEAHIARLEQRLEVASTSFNAAAALADEQGMPDIALRALLGLGETLELLGERKRALDVYARSEALLDQHVLDVPVGEGRAAFLARHDASAKAEIALAIALSQPARAFAVARNARARAMRALEDAVRLSTFDAQGRARFRGALTRYRQGREALIVLARQERELAVADLERARTSRLAAEANLLESLEREVSELASLQPRPAARAPWPGLTLLFHPLRQGWVGFASDAQGLKAQISKDAPEAISKEALAAQLLAPFEVQLSRAKQVQVLSLGVLNEVDFHALPFHGAPLIEHAPVSYPLDLQVAEAVHAEAVRGPALIIADPSSDLPRARREAEAAAEALHEAGLTVTSLGGDEVTTEAVTRAISTASHIHFAGHAISSGNDGWQSVLSLARGETMSMGDVLSSQTNARSVVLSSCQAGKGNDGDLATLSMGAAFAIAGAQAVIAPTRPVADEDAASLVSAMYAHAEGIVDVDWAAALQAAQRDLRIQQPNSDWSAFRVITR